MFTKEQIEAAVKAKGYKWFESNADYDVNIVGVRNSSTGKSVTNLFDDWITVSFKINGEWQFYCWNISTEPGKRGVMEFHNINGVARLAPGQYPVYEIAKHQGKYDALCQRNGDVTVYRDANKDMIFDEKVTDTGSFGINIHKAGQDSTWVENWSEGCQVFKRVKDFDEFMSICKKAAQLYCNQFTYTLIESGDIIL